MTTQVISLKFQQTTSRSSEPEPTKEVKEPKEVKGRVRSISRVFSRMTSTLSSKSTQISVDKSSKGHLTPRHRSMNRVTSKVFSLASEDGIVITSTRKVEDKKNFTKVFQLHSEKGVVITSTRKVDEPQNYVYANDNSTLSTILSHEDSKECNALQGAQLQKDALLLELVKQTAQSTIANDEVRNTSMPDALIIADAKKTSCCSPRPSFVLPCDKKDGETTIFDRIRGAVGVCSIGLCFESQPKKNREGESIIMRSMKDDDMSSLSGMSRFYE